MLPRATEGKILTRGGWRSYDGSAATSNAHVFTLANQAVHVEKTANGVALLDGKVIILGDTTDVQLFSDLDPVLFSEVLTHAP